MYSCKVENDTVGPIRSFSVMFLSLACS